jgi:hypothetical protein
LLPHHLADHDTKKKHLTDSQAAVVQNIVQQPPLISNALYQQVLGSRPTAVSSQDQEGGQQKVLHMNLQTAENEVQATLGDLAVESKAAALVQAKGGNGSIDELGESAGVSETLLMGMDSRSMTGELSPLSPSLFTITHALPSEIMLRMMKDQKEPGSS